jgi:hypothetical protein
MPLAMRSSTDAPVRVPQGVSVGMVSDVRGGTVRGRLFVVGRGAKNACERGFSRRKGIGTTFAISALKASPHIRWRAAMNLNHEALMLRSLFGICVLICTMTLGSMLLV